MIKAINESDQMADKVLEIIKKWVKDTCELSVEYPECSLQDMLAKSLNFDINNLLEDPNIVRDLRKSIDCSLRVGRNQDYLVGLVKNLLVDSCWLNKVTLDINKNPSNGSRSQLQADLIAASESVTRLQKTLRNLNAGGRAGFKVSSLLERLKSDNPVGFSRQGNGWSSALKLPSGPSIIELLDSVSGERIEEAAILGIQIDESRQKKSKHADSFLFIDRLLSISIRFGRLDRSGNECPEFRLVYAIFSALQPDVDLDASTIRKRWKNR